MKSYASLLTGIIATTLAVANEPYWNNDYDSAIKEAIESNRLLMLYFTGSDWCFWCSKLDRELFAQDEFASSIEIHAVPVRVDFPRCKKLPFKQARANRMLRNRFKVVAYPTVILCDPVAERELLRHGYFETTPDLYLEAFEKYIGSLNPWTQ